MRYTPKQRSAMVQLMYKYESPAMAKRAFKHLYPHLNPARETFTYNRVKYEATQSCHHRKHRERSFSLVKERTSIIKTIITHNPEKSIRQIASQTGIPRTYVHNILTKVLKLKPYRKYGRH